MALGERHKRVDCAPADLGVGIEEQHKPAAPPGNSEVTGPREAEVPPRIHVVDLWEPLRNHGSRAVTAVVVDQNHLQIEGVRAEGDRGEAPLDQVRTPIRHDHQCDIGRRRRLLVGDRRDSFDAFTRRRSTIEASRTRRPRGGSAI